jgi:hypothetical protein
MTIHEQAIIAAKWHYARACEIRATTNTQEGEVAAETWNQAFLAGISFGNWLIDNGVKRGLL